MGKKIPGANFGTTNGNHWTFPLDISTLITLRRMFKSELEYSTDLREWGWEQKHRLKQMRAIAKLDRVEDLKVLQRLYPKLYKAVVYGRKYQSVGVEYINAGRKVIIADTVGLGKSAQTLGGILEADLGGRHAIVCPKTACLSTWVPEILHWTEMKLPVHWIPEGREARNRALEQLGQELEPGEDEFWVFHPQMLNTRAYWECRKKVEGRVCGVKTQITSRAKELKCKHKGGRTVIRIEHEFPQVFDALWSTVTVDENHKSLLRRSAVPSQIRRGMEMLKIRPDGLQIAQSATPWASKPYHLWSVLNWLFPERYTSFRAWVEARYETTETFGNAVEIGEISEAGEKILAMELDGVMLRRTREEVRGDLPPRMYMGTPFHYGDDNSPVGIWLPMEGEQARQYQEMALDGVARVKDGNIQAIGALAELTRMKQLASSCGMMTDRGFKPCLPSNKFDKLLEILEERGIPDEPQTRVVVVSQHTELLGLFALELNKRRIATSMLTGSASPKRRAEIQRLFTQGVEAGGPYVLMLNLKVGGAAITLDGCDDMVILDESFEFDDMDQVEGRTDNRRPEEKIVQRRYHYLRSIDSVDVGIALANAEDRGVTQRLLDGRRGVTFVRRVLELSDTATRTTGVQ